MALTGQKNENLYFEDTFNRADGATVGEPWSSNGTLAIENGALHQTDGAGASAAGIALIDLDDIGEGIGNEVHAGLEVACEDDTSSREAQLILRASDATMTDAYIVRLAWESDVATLSIIKRTSQSNTTAESVVVTSEMNTLSNGSYDGVFQQLSGRLLITDTGIKVEAFLNDEERPRLTATDGSQPLHTVLSHVGIRLNDNDAGVGGHLFARNFWIQGIQSGVSVLDWQGARNWTVGETIRRARSMALRDSSDLTQGEDWLGYVNMALSEYYDKLGNPEWAEKYIEVRVKSGTTEIELPAWVDHFSNSIKEGTRGEFPIVNQDQFNRDYAGVSETETGSPYLYRILGRGPSGGMILKPFPIPSSEYTFNLHCYQRHGWIEDKALPLPLPDAEALRICIGAIAYYLSSDGPRDRARNWEARWQAALRKASRANTRRRGAGEQFIIRPAFASRGGTGIVGRTRAGGLGDLY